MKSTMQKVFTIVLLFVFSNANGATSIHCGGNVRNAWIQSDGYLLISVEWTTKPVGLCNVVKKHNGISPETCKTWVSVALTALSTQKPTTMQFYNLKKCSDIKGYTASEKPHYFMLQKSEV